MPITINKLYPIAFSDRSFAPACNLKNHRVETIGEFRIPKKGEWFISGAIPEGYIAKSNGMKQEYNIARLVRVKTKTEIIYTVLQVIK